MAAAGGRRNWAEQWEWHRSWRHRLEQPATVAAPALAAVPPHQARQVPAAARLERPAAAPAAPAQAAVPPHQLAPAAPAAPAAQPQAPRPAGPARAAA
jgi:hypothetical protein